MNPPDALGLLLDAWKAGTLTPPDAPAPGSTPLPVFNPRYTVATAKIRGRGASCAVKEHFKLNVTGLNSDAAQKAVVVTAKIGGFACTKSVATATTDVNEKKIFIGRMPQVTRTVGIEFALNYNGVMKGKSSARVSPRSSSRVKFNAAEAAKACRSLGRLR